MHTKENIKWFSWLREYLDDLLRFYSQRVRRNHQRTHSVDSRRARMHACHRRTHREGITVNHCLLTGCEERQGFRQDRDRFRGALGVWPRKNRETDDIRRFGFFLGNTPIWRSRQHRFLKISADAFTMTPFQSHGESFSGNDVAPVGGGLQPLPGNQCQRSVNLFPLASKTSNKRHHRRRNLQGGAWPGHLV